MKQYLDDILVVLGCGMLITATAIRFGLVAALYVTGAILIALGVLIGKGMKS